MSEKHHAFDAEHDQTLELLFLKFILLNEGALRHNATLQDLEKIANMPKSSRRKRKKDRNWLTIFSFTGISVFLVTVALCGLLNKSRILDTLVENTLGVRCVVPNNYFVWEATRPITDCNMCANLTQVIDLGNVTRESFAPYAYTSQPIVIRGAAQKWPARHVFKFNFFKQLFADLPESYETIEEDCQFLSFKTEFLGLKEMFEMPVERVLGKPGCAPWYVGWSVCHSDMVKEMRKYYPRPHFLPSDAEHSHLDYVFMGYQQGAVMHLDYISRLMWQAQLIGRKTWDLVPPPECDSVCSNLSVTVEEGDIIVLDTRQWYHDTHVEPGLFSLTVSSEYG